MKLPVVVDIDQEALAESLDSEAAMTLIKAIDLAQADWGFTVKVARHFAMDLQAGAPELIYTDWLKGLK